MIVAYINIFLSGIGTGLLTYNQLNGIDNNWLLFGTLVNAGIGLGYFYWFGI